MPLVYLQSVYSKSCFSECSRNKQQALSLLKVSKLAFVARLFPAEPCHSALGPSASLAPISYGQ